MLTYSDKTEDVFYIYRMNNLRTNHLQICSDSANLPPTNHCVLWQHWRFCELWVDLLPVVACTRNGHQKATKPALRWKNRWTVLARLNYTLFYMHSCSFIRILCAAHLCSSLYPSQRWTTHSCILHICENARKCCCRNTLIGNPIKLRSFSPGRNACDALPFRMKSFMWVIFGLSGYCPSHLKCENSTFVCEQTHGANKRLSNHIFDCHLTNGIPSSKNYQWTFHWADGIEKALELLWNDVN